MSACHCTKHSPPSLSSSLSLSREHSWMDTVLEVIDDADGEKYEGFQTVWWPEAAGRLRSALYLAQTELFISLPLYQHEFSTEHLFCVFFGVSHLSLYPRSAVHLNCI